jgi:ClpX C4-type zinc finger
MDGGDPSCEFCGKPTQLVRTLAVGELVYICDECIIPDLLSVLWAKPRGEVSDRQPGDRCRASIVSHLPADQGHSRVGNSERQIGQSDGVPL